VKNLPFHRDFAARRRFSAESKTSGCRAKDAYDINTHAHKCYQSFIAYSLNTIIQVFLGIICLTGTGASDKFISALDGTRRFSMISSRHVSSPVSCLMHSLFRQLREEVILRDDRCIYLCSKSLCLTNKSVDDAFIFYFCERGWKLCSSFRRRTRLGAGLRAALPAAHCSADHFDNSLGVDDSGNPRLRKSTMLVEERG